MIASARSSAARRSSNGSSTTNIEPKFELFEVSRIDCPEMATVVFTPGVCTGQPFDPSHGFLRPLHRGRVGQLHVH